MRFKRKIYFRAMRGKPLLTDDDVKARFALAKKYLQQSAVWHPTPHKKVQIKARVFPVARFQFPKAPSQHNLNSNVKNIKTHELI